MDGWFPVVLGRARYSGKGVGPEEQGMSGPQVLLL